MVSAFGTFVGRRSVHALSEAVQQPKIDERGCREKTATWRQRARKSMSECRFAHWHLPKSRQSAGNLWQSIEQLVPQLLVPISDHAGHSAEAFASVFYDNKNIATVLFPVKTSGVFMKDT